MLRSIVLCAIIWHALHAIAAPLTSPLDDMRASSTTAMYLPSTGTISTIPPMLSDTDSPSPADAPPASATVSPAPQDPNFVLWSEQPIRGNKGANILGPKNGAMALQNPDILAPPTTDSGSVPNAKWPFVLSHNRLQTGGWARQQNVEMMPLAKSMAGVDMRLKPGAIRELHWHNTAEWAYVIKGSVQVTAVNSDGQNYVSTADTGDLWYFPAGIPHSLQATDDDPDGAEFLLVFNDGTFSEDATFLLTDWLAHVPKEVLAKNFKTDISAFDRVPSEELYIFPSAPPPHDAEPVSNPQGQVPYPFVFRMSQMNATQVDGGSVKIVDSTTFQVSKAISVAEVTVEPGAMREMHWHPTQDEWSYFLEGTARVTLFASSGNARTFNYQGGDVGFVPASYGHYVENIGNTTLRFLEVFNSGRYADISLHQWLALTPPDLVKAHLGFSDGTIARLSKTKNVVIGSS
ncbi:oxalate decarboxylase [Earliella scabrosa]|nr:oxalate decarboxylase [Earliella scabrosa]